MIPNEPTLAGVAQQIVQGRATDNLQFFVVFGVLLALAGIVIYFIAPYLAERGKLLAMAETLERRLEEIRQTTDAAERIKAEISHSDWTVKEYKTLRRIKLENLVGAANKLLRACEADVRPTAHEESPELASREFELELHQISLLYFAEMKAETEELIARHNSFAIWVIDWRTKLRHAGRKVMEEQARLEFIRTSTSHGAGSGAFTVQSLACERENEKLAELQLMYANEYRPIIFALRTEIKKLEVRAAMLMGELIAPVQRD